MAKDMNGNKPKSEAAAKGKFSLTQLVQKNFDRIFLILLFTIYKIYAISWFYIIENVIVRDEYHIIHHPWDDKIPFVEEFIVPYATWFPFVNVPQVVFALLGDVENFLGFLNCSLPARTIFFAVSTFWPNGLNIRPKEPPRDNIFVKIVFFFYRIDPPINVTPTIHVHDTIAAMIAVSRSDFFPKTFKILYNIWGVLICVAVPFVKQHSIVDVEGALVCNLVFYLISYKFGLSKKMAELYKNRKWLRFDKRE